MLPLGAATGPGPSAAAPIGALHVRVSRKRTEADGICSFELVDPHGAALPPFTAGAHIEVQVGGGLMRHYSLCNDPTETHRYLIGVLRDAASRGGSSALHDRIAEGDSLQISAPKNSFPLIEGAPHVLLLAGGIGVTPLLSMAERLSRLDASFELHYCARSRARAAFAERLGGSAYASTVRFHFDDEGPAPRLDLDALIGGQPAGTHLYVCGPKGYIDAVLGAAAARGWSPARLHCEYFATEVHHDSDGAFEVQLGRSGRVVAVAKSQTIVEALAAAGVVVQTSCEQGVCGTCLTTVLAGEPEHKDLYLTPEEHARGDQILPCCSRSRSPRLVLDL